MMIAAVLGVLVVSLAVQLTLSVWKGCARMMTTFETQSQWDCGYRVMQHDVHAALTASVISGNLTLTEADGTRYTYAVNSAGQYVRIRTGGGTAVLMTGVVAVDVSVSGRLVHWNVSFQDGSARAVDMCMLPG